MVKLCPVSDRLVDENLCRLNALFTCVFACGFLATGSFWFLWIMTADFILRLLNKGLYSPVIRLNKYILSKLNISKSLINAGPKIFAGQIGLVLTLFGLLFLLISLPLVTIIFAGILGILSFLELSSGFCIACKIYPYALLLNDR